MLFFYLWFVVCFSLCSCPVFIIHLPSCQFAPLYSCFLSLDFPLPAFCLCFVLVVYLVISASLQYSGSWIFVWYWIFLLPCFMLQCSMSCHLCFCKLFILLNHLISMYNFLFIWVMSNYTHPSIHSFIHCLPLNLWSGHWGSSQSRETQTSLSPATWIISSTGIPRFSQAGQEV